MILRLHSHLYYLVFPQRLLQSIELLCVRFQVAINRARVAQFAVLYVDIAQLLQTIPAEEANQSVYMKMPGDNESETIWLFCT